MHRNASPPRRSRPIKLRCVTAGHTSYPYVGDLTEEGLEIWHRTKGTTLPLPWQELILAGAALANESPQEFLRRLARLISASSGPSPEKTSDGGRCLAA